MDVGVGLLVWGSGFRVSNYSGHRGLGLRVLGSI